MNDRLDRAQVRLAELVAALSLGIDLGFGQPMEHVLRQCLIALRIAERAQLADEERAAVYYTALLINVGCHTDAHEQAKWFGDDIALKAGKYEHGIHGVRAMAATVRMLGAGNSPLERFRVLVAFAIAGHRELDGMIEQHARLARAFARRLGLSEAVSGALGAAYEQWDGDGWPGALRAEAIPVAARIAALAEFAEVAHRAGGPDAVRALARRHAGGQFDPWLAGILADDADAILAGLDAVGTWDAVIAAEPALAVVLSGADFDAALTTVGDFVDLKSPYTLGHARAVAELVSAAAERLALPADEASDLRRAPLVHDIGRLGVSNAILDKPGALGAGERERVRMHPPG